MGRSMNDDIDLFDIENDTLDRMLMAFAPDPQPGLDDDLIDDRTLDELLAEADELLAEADELLAEIRRKSGGGDGG
jgi:hypothetical protein